MKYVTKLEEVFPVVENVTAGCFICLLDANTDDSFGFYVKRILNPSVVSNTLGQPPRPEGRGLG